MYICLYTYIYAAKYGCTAIVTMLIGAGADVQKTQIIAGIAVGDNKGRY